MSFAVYVDDVRIMAVTTRVKSVGAIRLQFELVKTTQIPSTQSLKVNLQLWIDNPRLSRCMMCWGQAVREIATGHYPAGTHKATLDASGLATGVYLHKPQANSFIDVNILVIYQ